MGAVPEIRESDRVYTGLRSMAIRFELKPGERVTELDIAERFSVSRTPVREALNRLVKDGFLVADGNRRFAVRSLDPKESFDLYELRLALESTAVRLAVERASDKEMEALVKMARKFHREPADITVERVVELDEQFHEQIAALSGNSQLLETLRSINARIRFVRLIDMENKPRSRSLGDHVAVAVALQARKPEAAIAGLREHITHKMQDIVDVIRRGIAKIYVDDFDRQVSAD
jgi:DNA-binding GntR family transcriptional regulator